MRNIELEDGRIQTLEDRILVGLARLHERMETLEAVTINQRTLIE